MRKIIRRNKFVAEEVTLFCPSRGIRLRPRVLYRRTRDYFQTLLLRKRPKIESGDAETPNPPVTLITLNVTTSLYPPTHWPSIIYVRDSL